MAINPKILLRAEILISKIKKLFEMPDINQQTGDNSINIASSRDTTIINISDDRFVRKVQDAYSHIYYWHHRFGKDYFKNYVYGEDIDNDYLELLNNIQRPFLANMDEMIKIAREVKIGRMAFSSGKKSNFSNKDLIVYANYILTITKELAAFKLSNSLSSKDYYELAKSKLLGISEDLRILENTDLNKLNIGGMIAVLQTNKAFETKTIVAPTVLGFQKIVEEKNLVNLAKKGLLKIPIVRLAKPSNKLKIELEIINTQEDEILFEISKGQIFENNDVNQETQNLVSSEKQINMIQPLDTIHFSIDAYCLNRSLDYPSSVGHIGNITIFEAENKKFFNQDEIWDVMSEIKKEIENYSAGIKSS